MFDLINRVRKEPRWFALHLKKVSKRFKGLKLFSHSDNERAALERKKAGEKVPVTFTLTSEGAPAYEEAISYLDRSRPTKPLNWSAQLQVACLDHVQELGSGDNAADVMSVEQRVEQFAQMGDPWAESLVYGAKTPLEALEKLLVCDGQKKRPNRSPIFEKELLECAVAAADHDSKGTVIQLLYVNKLYFKPEFNLSPTKMATMSDKLSDGLELVLRRSSVGMSQIGDVSSQQDKTELLNKLNRSIGAPRDTSSRSSVARRGSSVQRLRPSMSVLAFNRDVNSLSLSLVETHRPQQPKKYTLDIVQEKQARLKFKAFE